MLHLVTLGAQLRDRGVGLQVMEQGINTATAEGRAMFRERNAGNTPLLNLQSNSARRPQAANVRGDEAVTGKGDRHVVPNPKGGWDVKAPEVQRASAHTNTQAEAITRARETASNAGGETVIHGRDGAIRVKDSSGGQRPPASQGVRPRCSPHATVDGARCLSLGK